MAISIPATSKEYLKGSVSSTNATLDTQTVEVAFVASTAYPDGSTTWYPAAWEGVAGATRDWRLLVGDGTATPSTVLAAGQYAVFVRVTDTTEVPVRRHEAAPGKADVLTVH